jgi:hypothetical protein
MGIPRQTSIYTAAAAFVLTAVFCQGGCGGGAFAMPTCTLTPPAQDVLCTALADYDSRCGHCQDCTAQNLQNCTKASATVSDAYRSAFSKCSDRAPCDADPRFSACVLGEMAAAQPTSSQQAAKAAYCAACGATNAADCAGFFAIGATSGKTGPGYNVLLYGDAVAANAVSVCSAKCDPFQYGVCVALLSCGPSGGDHCADSGFCAAQ